MKISIRLFLALLLFAVEISPLIAREVSPIQFLFTIRRIFPDQKKLTVFISQSKLEKVKPLLVRAAAQNKFNVKVHIIESTTDIGKSFREIDNNIILLIFDSPVLNHRKNRLYILKKCKEKKISIITSSKEYSDSGALLALLVNAENKIDVVVNLKHCKHLKDKFTEEFIRQNGIKEVIQ